MGDFFSHTHNASSTTRATLYTYIHVTRKNKNTIVKSVGGRVDTRCVGTGSGGSIWSLSRSKRVMREETLTFNGTTITKNIK